VETQLGVERGARLVAARDRCADAYADLTNERAEKGRGQGGDLLIAGARETTE
jgi:hypothetical protein